MSQHLAHLALLVPDYDEAIAWYRDKLRFELVEDTMLSSTKRWVLMRPPGTGRTGILLAKASNAEQIAAIGNQSGGRVLLFLHTNDFDRDYAHMKASGVEFAESPRLEPYGKVVVFYDLYGNKWDFIQPVVQGG